MSWLNYKNTDIFLTTNTNKRLDMASSICYIIRVTTSQNGGIGRHIRLKI